MTGCIFYFENHFDDVYSGTQNDLDAWRYAMKQCGDIKDVIVINKSDMSLRGLDQYFNWTVTSDPVAVTGTVCRVSGPQDPGTHTSLFEFSHECDWYYFGRASGWVNPAPLSITIPTDAPTVPLHALHAAHIVFAHRRHVLA